MPEGSAMHRDFDGTTAAEFDRKAVPANGDSWASQSWIATKFVVNYCLSTWTYARFS
jgi:hypothetical protein